MSVYQLYGAPTSSTDDVSSFDIQFDGEITAWVFELGSVAIVDSADRVRAEVSFLSSSCFTSNDARGVIAANVVGLGLTTSGAAPNSNMISLSGLRIPVSGGERVHLHVNLSGVTSSWARAILYVLDDADPRLRRRR